MHIDYDNYEYRCIVKEILDNREFKKLEGHVHHGTNRLEHSKRVSFYSYKLSKRLGLDYVSAARGGLLHDFFLNGYKKKEKADLLVNHPNIALYNAGKHFELNDMEKDIIKCHMFPVNMKYIPKYKESYVVTFIDKMACVYERIVSCRCKARFGFSKAMIYLFLIITC